MLACGHARNPFGEAMCSHLRACRKPWLNYFRWYTGTGMGVEYLCSSCAKERQEGRTIVTAAVCQECFEYATTEVGNLEGVRGKPEIRIRSESINPQLRMTRLPLEAVKVIDICPIDAEDSSTWVLLADSGAIYQFDADTGASRQLACTSLTAEPDHEPWCGHILKKRLHVSVDGRFASIVHDYGRYGQMIDLRTGRLTLTLDGGTYHPETVPFSFAFAQINGQPVAIHRTDWNRLDISDPANGRLLTDRSPTSYRSSEEQPPHYLDYFHGALHVSPNSLRIADDGWVWHPIGVPTTWDLEPWLNGNKWESEDGPTRKAICARDYYWDHALTWLDDDRLAIGGIGDDDTVMVDGVRIFDIFNSGSGGIRWRSDWAWPREITAFAGPAGLFFSEGGLLFSSDQTGLSRWDINDGSRTGFIVGFTPRYHHRGAHELVQVVDDVLVRWRIDLGTSG